jgi:hypothetical protein
MVKKLVGTTTGRDLIELIGVILHHCICYFPRAVSLYHPQFIRISVNGLGM